MSVIDWSAFGLGAVAGAVAGAVFFIGLALGMRLALRSTRPGAILFLSGLLRIAGLLGFGWLVAQRGLAALAGLALGFMMMRFIAIAIARRPIQARAS